MSSINFQEPYSIETRRALEEFFGNAAGSDSRTLLFDHDQMKSIDTKLMSAVAKKERQPVDVSLHAPGDIKTMSDGTQYQVDEQGSWRRIWP